MSSSLSLSLSPALFLLPLSPPSLSTICLELSVYHAHLTNDPRLRYHIGAKNSDLNQSAGATHPGQAAGGLSFAQVCSPELTAEDSVFRYPFILLVRIGTLTAVSPVATITQRVFWFEGRTLKKKSHHLDISKCQLFNSVLT